MHLKEGCKPKAKKGLPGEFELKEIGDKVLLKKEIEAFGVEAVEYCKRAKSSFIELDKKGALVYRFATCALFTLARLFRKIKRLLLCGQFVKCL